MHCWLCETSRMQALLNETPKDCDDGHIDVLSLTSVPERKERHDKDPMRNLLMYKPRTNQKDVHSLTLSREASTKNREWTTKTKHG